MRHTATILLLAATLALAGCSDTTSAKAEAKPSPTPTQDPGDKFMNAVTDAHLASWADKMPLVPARDELTAFPPQWCEALDAGHTVPWILDQVDLYPAGMDWGTEKGDAYRLVLLGAEAYCPKRVGQVREDLRASGEY